MRVLAAIAAVLFSCGLHAAPAEVADLNTTVHALPRAEPVRFQGRWLATLQTDDRAGLWWTDGTASGTQLITALPDFAYGLHVVGAAAYFVLGYPDDGGILYRTDGTAAGTYPVAGSVTVAPYLPAMSRPFAPAMGDANGVLFFRGAAGALWRSDGTAAGTYALTTFSVPAFAAAADRVYFAGTDATHGSELWSSDGTVAGTVLVADVNPGSSSSTPSWLRVIGNRVYFWAQGSDSDPVGLWSSDGTAAGTSRIGSFAQGSQHYPLDFSGKALVSGADEVLRLTDGTPAGTTVLASGGGTGGIDDKASSAMAGGFLYFNFEDALWRTDGTAAGTSYIAAGVQPDPTTSSGLVIRQVMRIASLGSDVYFVVWDQQTGVERLWTTSASGTSVAMPFPDFMLTPWAGFDGTMWVRSTFSGVYSGTPAWILTPGSPASVQPLHVAASRFDNGSACAKVPVAMSGKAYFTASDGTWGCRLWKSDGSAAGTVQLSIPSVQIAQQDLDSRFPLVASRGYVYLSAYTGTQGSRQIWRTDGTSSGFSRVLDQAASSGGQLVALGDSLYYTEGPGVVRIDAATAATSTAFTASAQGGTQIVSMIAAATKLYVRMSQSSGEKLITFDPATSIVTPLDLGGASISSWSVLGDTLVYTLDTAPLALVRTDGTSAGTAQVATLPGAVASFAGLSGSLLYIVAGQEVWATDGTANGTRSVASFGAVPVVMPIDASTVWIATPSTPSFTGGLYFLHSGILTRFADAPFGVTDASVVRSSVVFVAQAAADATPGVWIADSATQSARQVMAYGTRYADRWWYGLNAIELPAGAFFFAHPANDGWEPYLLPSADLPTGRYPSAAKVDFDGDGFADLVLEHANGAVEIRLIHGTTAGASATFVPSASGHVVPTSGDFDGDGRADLLYARDDGAVEMWLMAGTQRLAIATVMPTGNGWSVAHVADFDGDGKSDILWHNTNGATSLWLMNGTTVVQRAPLMAAGSAWTATHVGDFDGDGKADILWRNAADGSVSMWLMNGPLVADRGSLLPAGSPWSALRVADFDGDGKSDILWQGTDGSVSMWLMNGRAIASRAPLMGANTNWTVTHTADFNGDGKADLVWLGRDGTIGTWLMNGGTVLEKRTQFGAGTGWSCTVAQDMSADDKADIIWSNTNGGVGDWLMDGTSNIAHAPLEPAGSTNKVVPVQFHH